MEDQHDDQGNGEAEQALPADDLEGLDARPLQQVLLQHELRGGEDLRAGDQQDANGGAEGLGAGIPLCPLLPAVFRSVVRPDGAGEPDERHARHDADQRGPLEEVQLAAQEDDAEQADEQDERAPRHLVDRRCHHEQPRVHERRAADVAESGEREEQDPVAAEHAVGDPGLVVVVVFLVAVAD